VTEAARSPEPAWRASEEMIENSRLAEFTRWLQRDRDLHLDSYGALWRWSVDDVEGFWKAIWDFFGVRADGDPEPVLGVATMPGAEWFPGTALNYAEHVFAAAPAGDAPAIVYASESAPPQEVSWAELRGQVAAAAAALRELGVGRGDRVVAYMPNVPETVVAFLATASLGAVWSSCSPDFGTGSVVDRFAQIEPTVLLACEKHTYGGRHFDRREVVAELEEKLPTLKRTIRLSWWYSLLARHEGADLSFERVPFDHPLWILYSSGTTGLPKAIVQGHGGIVLEHLKVLSLHVDLGPGSRFFWFTTTGWMMWNFLVSGLLTGATIVLYDGNPGYPDLGALWDLTAAVGVTVFGTSASYIGGCLKAGLEPARGRDLSRLVGVGSTGSPLSVEGFDWVYEQLGPDIWLFSTSGGTDVCTAFLGGVVSLPVYRGELQAATLGVALDAWGPEGESLVGEVGELVVTEPMPSMPLYFWNDPDGARYRESYFEMYPGIWRHGDWLELTERGTAIVHGRSDSTINRGGIRMGTSEIYRAVLGLEEVVDALAVDLPGPDGEGWMPLFVVLREGAELDDDLEARIRAEIRRRCSPRHVPNQIHAIAEVPRTLTGKVLEVPVKRILMGVDPTLAVSKGSLANPGALEYFIGRAETGPAA
jgi:acetoacetyl-CoA synthetase